MKPITSFLLFCCLWLSASAASFEPRAGSTIAFVGDSITHQCLYTQYLEDFFYTRYPDLKLRMHNAGVAGDSVRHVLDRLEKDIAEKGPSYATILLGMNDGGYKDFEPELFTDYSEGNRKLLEEMTGKGIAPILLSPSMFDYPMHLRRVDDETYRFRTASRNPNYNAVLAYYGAASRMLASEIRIPYIDLWTPMNDFTQGKRLEDESFTLLPDAIHPSPGGHVLMAYTILMGMEPSRKTVSSIQIQKNRDKWSTRAVGGAIENFTQTDQGIEFEFTAQALPWVLPEKATEAQLRWEMPLDAVPTFQELTKNGHRLSTEVLRVHGLPPGRYALWIDEEEVETFTHTALASRVELQKFPNTPQQKQSLEVAVLNRKRNDEAVRPMRDVWSRIKRIKQKDSDQREKLLQEAEGLRKKAWGFEQEIHSMARPKKRHYRLLRAE